MGLTENNTSVQGRLAKNNPFIGQSRINPDLLLSFNILIVYFEKVFAQER